MDIEKIQAELLQRGFDGWLLYDFHGHNEVAVKMLGLEGYLSRRSACYIPSQGTPVILVNPVEAAKFRHLPGEIRTYRGYKGLETELAGLLKPGMKIAMEYSPQGRLPYIGLIDAGTIEMIRSTGVEIGTSADLVAQFYARLSAAQAASHRRAAAMVNRIKDEAFARIADHLKRSIPINEYDVVAFIMDRFAAEGMVTDYEPNCSVDHNAGDPHYCPAPESSVAIKPGNLILIDLWARYEEPDGVYGDITWMAFAGPSDAIPEEYRKRFALLTSARDAAVAFLQEQLPQRTVGGYEVDDVCRGVLEKGGYGELFTHRTGHSITSSVHGEGPNIDNLETEDSRVLQAGHLFSIEPGLYQSDFGLRTEINCLITETGAEITTQPLQREIIPLL